MNSRTFQVLYVPDGLIAGCVDAIRVLASPAEKNRAHITVRGPYPGVANLTGTINRVIESSEIYIHGSGNFFDSGQNTVYLRCKSSKLETVWDKPDYGFNPHITLYDGPSHEFAKKLWDIASSRTYDISFIAGPLTPLVSSRRHQGGMSLRADLDLRLVRDVTGLDLDISGMTVDSLGEDQRLKAIDKLCDYLSTIDSRLDFSQGPPLKQPDVEVKEVGINSQMLSSIKALARRNSSTLGFLPEGAFDAYAQRDWILAATASGDLVGYLAYRVARMRAVLVHLCIEEKYRGQGIARQLFRGVVERTAELHGILANTRRDFPAHTLWPRLGFAAIGERPGRGMNRSVLTRWWYEHPHPTLFSNNASFVSAQSPIDVAIDLKVFYDLVMPSSKEREDESRSLQSDWLIDEVQLCVTGELFNEINNLESPQSRQRQRALAHGFKRISGSAESFARMYSLLSSIMGGAKSEREASDLRHLAHAAAADAEFFVTWNNQILESKKEIESAIGVTPMGPTDLVVEIDQVRNSASYQPARLRGSRLQIQTIGSQRRKILQDTFVNSDQGETKETFRQRLSAVSQIHPASDSRVVLNDGEPVALFYLDGSKMNVLEVPLLRLRQGRMARTLAREIVTTAVDSSIVNKSSITEVTDEWLEPYVEEALAEGGFVKAGAHWLKLNYAAIGTEDSVSDGLKRLLVQLQDSGLELPRQQGFPSRPGFRMTAAETVLVEKNLRPLKLTNDALDTLVIPVKPRWAQHLFDSGLAEQTLFGAIPDLVLSWENAYYRSPRSLGDISAPFRILWYVSRDGRYIGTGQIRAYSVASNVELLPAAEAYNRYKRLGVYNLRQVLEISGGDPDGRVMVIRFCDIEMLKNPIDRKRFSALLELLDQKRPSLRGPQRISEAAFAAIYREGQS